MYTGEYNVTKHTFKIIAKTLNFNLEIIDSDLLKPE